MAHSTGGRHPYPRSARINQILREVISEELLRISDVDERLGLLTVTGVATTEDLRQAMVYLHSLNDDSRVALEERRAQIQAAVNARPASSERPSSHSWPTRPSRAGPPSRKSCVDNAMTTNNGLLLIDKPQGITSHDVVARVRLELGERRVGHAGTLDPMATGLLVLAVGPSTRLLRFAQSESKRYSGTVTFGVATDSLDADGQVLERRAPPSSRVTR